MSLWPQLSAARRRIGYARVSTPEQRLDIQLEGLEAVACDAVYTDHGVSGGLKHRPGLDRALAALEPGDVLVVFKLDRLGRSVLHLADLLTHLDKGGIHFCSIAEGINTTTPGGRLVYHIFSAIAEFQRDMIRENTILGLQAARERGAKIGRPRVVNIETALAAHQAIRQDHLSIAACARRHGVSRSSLTRALARISDREV